MLRGQKRVYEVADDVGERVRARWYDDEEWGCLGLLFD